MNARQRKLRRVRNRELRRLAARTKCPSGKVVHWRAETADKHADGMEGLETYHCDLCGFFHVGHPFGYGSAKFWKPAESSGEGG